MSLVHANKNNFNQEVKESNIPVIVDFYADWCGPCKMLAPIFEELAEEYKEKVKFVKVNTEGNEDLANEYDVKGIPCLVLIKEGKEVDRIVGLAPKEEIKNKINAIL
jgi:thioredoxin 1